VLTNDTSIDDLYAKVQAIIDPEEFKNQALTSAA